jgi:NAD(P)-dependent dehydrogenase (short-subunit alcohol dehydrogenase family)
MNLDGKHVLITGGAGGIGAAIAELFAEKGAVITVTDLQQELGNQLVARLGPKHRFVTLDVSKYEAWTSAVESLPPIDILILNAGTSTRPKDAPYFDDPLKWIKPHHLHKLFGVNVAGVVNGINACLPSLESRSGATVFVTSSTSGIRPFLEDPLYVLTKYSLVGFVGALGPTFEAKGMRIICVCPNGIDTPGLPREPAAKKRAAQTFSSPRFMAEAFLEIYGKAKSGEVWIGGAQQPPRRHDTPLCLPIDGKSEALGPVTSRA